MTWIDEGFSSALRLFDASAMRAVERDDAARLLPRFKRIAD